MQNICKTALFSLVALFTFAQVPAQAGALNDATIYAIFDQANMADIATGRLGSILFRLTH